MCYSGFSLLYLIYSLAIVLALRFSSTKFIENLFAIFSVSPSSFRLLCDDVCPPNSPSCVMGVSNSSTSKTKFDKLKILWRCSVMILNFSPMIGWKVL